MLNKKIYFVAEGIVDGEVVQSEKFNQIVNPDTREMVFEDVFQITECTEFEKYREKDEFLSCVIEIATEYFENFGQEITDITVVAIDVESDIFQWGVSIIDIGEDGFQYRITDWKKEGTVCKFLEDSDEVEDNKLCTVKEFATAFEGVLAEVNTTEYFGITFEMSKARIEYSEEDGEITFTTGNYNYDGVGAVIVKEDLIDTIEYDEESDQYLISFTSDIPAIVVSRFKDLEKLKQECVERKQQ